MNNLGQNTENIKNIGQGLKYLSNLKHFEIYLSSNNLGENVEN